MNPTETPIKILETLGVGSFGVVCVVRLQSGGIERTVALKVLKGEWLENAEVLSRTRDEARLLAILNHPYIVKVEQLITLWGLPAMVMEYVPGASLFTLAKEAGAFPLSVAMCVAQRTAGALHAAYHRPPLGKEKPLHVVHRDIKPSNVLIGIDGEVKVLDFGTARGEFDARESNTRILGFGSMGYLAPERLAGVVRDPAIDVYSLGVTLYEILAARRMGTLGLRRETHPQDIMQRLGQMTIYGGSRQADDDTRRLLYRMMSYDAAERPSAQEIAQSAEAILRILPSEYHISTEAYAREIVEPIYLNRERLAPPENLRAEDLLLEEHERLLVWARSQRSTRPAEPSPAEQVGAQPALPSTRSGAQGGAAVLVFDAPQLPIARPVPVAPPPFPAGFVPLAPAAPPRASQTGLPREHKTRTRPRPAPVPKSSDTFMTHLRLGVLGGLAALMLILLVLLLIRLLS